MTATSDNCRSPSPVSAATLRAGAIGVLLLVGLAATGFAQETRSLAAARRVAAMNGEVRVIVGLRLNNQGAGDAQRRASIAQAQATLLGQMRGQAAGVRQFSTIPYIAMTVPAHALETLAARPDVESVRVSLTNEPFLVNSTEAIGAPAAWNLGFAGTGWGVAILDDGVDRNHPYFRALQSRVVSEACYSGGGNDARSLCPGGVTSSIALGSAQPCVECDHGTHVAGIAAGTVGVASAAHIIGIQVFSSDADGDGRLEAFDDDIIRGLERVYELRASFNIAAVNLSLGGGRYFSYCDDESPAMTAVIDRLRAAGIATVAASGNAGWRDSMAFPACISTAISVGNANMYASGGTVAATSNTPAFTSLVAPGTHIESSVPGGQTQLKSGTSMAAPHVTGSWAIMKQRRRAASVDDVYGVLWNSSLNYLVPDYYATPTRYLRRPRLDIALGMWADPPGSTALISPRGSAESSFPVFIWYRAAGATEYLVRVYDDSGEYHARRVSDAEAGCAGATASTCSTSLPQALTGGAKTWWVLPFNSAGHGQWSEGYSFTVARAPERVTLIGPGGALDVSRPMYSWRPVAGATWYRLYVNDATGNRVHEWYTPLQAGCELNIGTCAVTPLTRLTTGAGRWWIQAYNSAGYSAWSDGMPFNFDKPAEVVRIFPIEFAGDESGNVRVTLSAEVRNASTAAFPSGYALWFKVTMPNGTTRWAGPASVATLGGSTSALYSVGTLLPSGGPYIIHAAVWLGNTLVSRVTPGPTVTLSF